MAKFIQLERMLHYGRVPRDAKLVWDSNAWRYRYEGRADNVVITQGIVEELSRFPHVFPEESIYSLALKLNPTIIDHPSVIDSEEPMISAENEATILRAASSINRGGTKNEKVHWEIGWVDFQQIGYALQRAQQGEHVVLVTEDHDLLKTVTQLQRTQVLARDKISVFSPRNYILELNKHRLYGLQRFVRAPMKKFIIEDYLVAA